MGTTIPDPSSPIFLSGWLLQGGGGGYSCAGGSVLSLFPVKQKAKPSAERDGGKGNLR